MGSAWGQAETAWSKPAEARQKHERKRRLHALLHNDTFAVVASQVVNSIDVAQKWAHEHSDLPMLTVVVMKERRASNTQHLQTAACMP